MALLVMRGARGRGALVRWLIRRRPVQRRVMAGPRLARALGVLPERVLLVGCQTADVEGLGQGLSPPVEAAVTVAAERVRSLAATMLDAATREATGPERAADIWRAAAAPASAPRRE